MKVCSSLKQIKQNNRLILLVLLSLVIVGCNNTEQSIEINNDNGHLQISLK